VEVLFQDLISFLVAKRFDDLDARIWLIGQVQKTRTLQSEREERKGKEEVSDIKEFVVPLIKR